jgi:heme A synthase
VLAVIVVLGLALVLMVTILAARAMGLDRGNEAALVFCGSQKSLVSGLPIANALVSGAAIGPILLPLMIYFPLQLLVGAWMARRYAVVAQRGDSMIGAPMFINLSHAWARGCTVRRTTAPRRGGRGRWGRLRSQASLQVAARPR